jgi:hypothetical protein
MREYALNHATIPIKFQALSSVADVLDPDLQDNAADPLGRSGRASQTMEHVEK